VSADHPGDALVDWLSGRHSDDRTNEVNRVGDAHLVLGALLHGHAEVPDDIAAQVDPDRIVLAGHSYGAYTAYATAAGSRGVEPHEHVSAVIGFQPYMRSMSDALLHRVNVPSLLVVSERDQVTPAHVDADRAWSLLTGRPSWRVDLADAGHQAISDISLYAELAQQVPDLPAIVRDYLLATAADGAPDWRGLMARQVAVAWAFLQVTLGLDVERGLATALEFESDPVARLQRR
jgi:predicted dienelactone hydrolase